MHTLLYSKESITKIRYSYKTPSQYKVKADRELNLSVKDTINNSSCGWLWHFMSTYNSRDFSIYRYEPEFNKDYIIILPYVIITFSGTETVRFVFETDEQLTKFFEETGIHKILNTNKFFNPIEIANKIKNKI